MYCTGTNISKQQLEIFSVEKTPDMPIALAVRISGSIPLYYEPIALDNEYKKINRKDSTTFINYFVDGGMLCNYPISIFDTCRFNLNPLECTDLIFNRETLGLKMERPEQIDSLQKNSIAIPSYNINKLSDYLNALSNLMLETLNRKYPNLENEKGRTIYISHGNIHAKIRRMMPEEKLLLFNNGSKAVGDFFDKKLLELEIIRADDSEEERIFFTQIFYELLYLFTTPFQEENFNFSDGKFFAAIAELGQKYAKNTQMKGRNANRGSRHFIYMNRTFFGLYNLMHDIKANNIIINNYKKFQ